MVDQVHQQLQYSEQHHNHSMDQHQEFMQEVEVDLLVEVVEDFKEQVDQGVMWKRGSKMRHFTETCVSSSMI